MKSKRLGFGSPTVMLFMVGMTTVGAGLITLSMGLDKNGNRGRAKAQATTLAETGMAELYDGIRNQMRTDNSYPYLLAQKNYQVDSVTIGTYSAKIADTKINMIDVEYGGEKVRRTEYEFVLEGTGTTVEGVRTKLKGKFTGYVEQGLTKITSSTTTGSTASKIWFPMAAMAANDVVHMETNNGIRTTGPNGRGAHIVANAGIELDTPSRDKETKMTNPDVVDIQGQFIVPSGAHARTVSPLGMGNSNGSKNYRSPALVGGGSLGDVLADTVASIASPVRFADKTTVGGWENNWKSAANKHVFADGNAALTAAQLTAAGFKIINAPARITGDFKILPGDKVIIMPTSSNPAENVVYVDGNVENMGFLRNAGVKLVTAGKYTDDIGSMYEVSDLESPLPNIDTVMNQSALISTSEMSDAIQFKTSASSKTGLIYSANGGIKINGSNAEFTGMLIAGGAGNLGQINIIPGGGASFVMHFDPAAGTAGAFNPSLTTTIDISYVPSGIWTPFQAERVKGWVEIR